MTSRWRDLVAEGCTCLVPGQAGISGKPFSLLVSNGQLLEDHTVSRVIPAHALRCFDSFSNETQLLEILNQTDSRDVRVMAPHLSYK